MVASCAIALAQAVPSVTVQERIDAMRQSPATVTHGQSSYPFLDCASALNALTKPRMCASGVLGAPGCCDPGEPGCTGGARPLPQAPAQRRAKAHADSTVH